ncbi:uncharacterized protein LOC133304530 [Gastrolobium bilobum]|uniref:uncharacterized protein LOC133304530 n=1 Tax=Gastrolobium bilobum TaxID=150636 RepID=UPI002AB06F5F|nr:uncharacterized protein LOC133304530 [Gastrolobium bilobum]
MAFTISRAQSALPGSEKENLDALQYKLKNSATVGDGGISSQLHLKSSLSSESSSQNLDKHVVLRRIRQRKTYNKAKSAVETLLGNSEANTASAQEQQWLQHGDIFSAP